MNDEFSKMNNLQLRSLCNKMRNLKINDGLLGKSYVSTLRNLLNIPDNQFIATNNININAPINVASRVSFQNKVIKFKILFFKCTQK